MTLLFLHPAASGFVLLSSLNICPTCFKRGAAKRCAACKCCKYCSVECQKLHWKLHKKICSALKEAVIGWSPSKETNLILHEMQQTCDNTIKQEEDETTTQLPGYDLFSKGLDLQNGMKDFLKGYPDPEKMGGQIERNVEEGNELIMEAAKLGLKGAQYATALNYLPGGFYHTNEEESMKEVHKWIELAAQNGHAEAQVTYGQKLWIEGHNGSHPVDKEKGLFWLRKALAHGVTDGHPDPMGNALSQKSFRCTLDSATNTARDLFLYKASPLIADEDSDYEELIHICADCGVGAALQHVQLVSRESGVMKY